MNSVPDPSPWQPSRSGWGAGTVTGLGTSPGTPPADPAAPAAEPLKDASAVVPGAERPSRGPRTDRRSLVLFGGLAGAVLVIGLAVVLVMTLRGGVDPLWDRPAAPSDVRPPLAKACPAPTALAPEEPTAPPRPGTTPGPSAGPRTVDTESGISYRAYGEPWQSWDVVWRAGTLEVPYKVGQHFVTESYPGGTYHASILSGAVPAADNDAIALNLECVGRQVAADVRAEYYPQPNRAESIRDERTTLGGRPAWVTVFRLRFRERGLSATDELAAVATIDVGRPTAAILYVSIPGTHRQFDHIVEDVLASVTTP